ncbi:MAG: diguanylate cyclase domain-containing protein [Mycobacterium sp.]
MEGLRVHTTTAEHAPARLDTALVWWGRIAVVVVLCAAALNLAGWAAGVEPLTRGFASWPQTTPWTSVLMAGLGIAILVQSGQPSHARVRFGRAVAVVAGVLAVVFLAEYATGSSFGLDQLWFSDAVRTSQATWPGRPSPQTASSVLLLAVPVGLMRLERRWSRTAWAMGLVAAVALPFVVTAGYLFEILSLVGVTGSTGMGISTAAAVALLIFAALATRPDRNPAAWLLARPDRMTLVRLGVILAGLPLLVSLSRLALLALGVHDDAAWVLSISVSTVVLGVATFYFSQREQRLLIEKEQLRAEAEKRYRILADNAVDIVVHLNRDAIVQLQGTEVIWISPSVQTAFGDPPQQWIGSDFGRRVHPEDLGTLTTTLNQIAPDKPALARFRVRNAGGNYHWVDCHAKDYLDAEGNTDGAIAALRIVDDQVAAQRQLERLARYDTLTGLVNRAETITRLQAALTNPRSPGPHLGVLFCDIDHFKTVNDTWGHTVGDVVLATVARRTRECLREGDTVGRVGGDEMVVLLPGLHNLDEAAQIAEKIRAHAAEPIYDEGNTVHATLSVGATLACTGESVTAITARADEAMYQAKQAGRNTVTQI